AFPGAEPPRRKVAALERVAQYPLLFRRQLSAGTGDRMPRLNARCLQLANQRLALASVVRVGVREAATIERDRLAGVVAEQSVGAPRPSGLGEQPLGRGRIVRVPRNP